MKSKFFRILAVLITISVVVSMTACSGKNGSTSQSETTSATKAQAEPIEGMYVFTFLDRYYKNVRLLEEEYGDKVNTEVFDIFDSPDDYDFFDVFNDDVHTYVNLPCGDGYIRNGSLIIESLDVTYNDLTDTEGQNGKSAVEALVVFHSLEGENSSIINGYTKETDELGAAARKLWKKDFEKSVELFHDNITVAISDQSVIDPLVAGETVLLYSGNYDYYFELRNYGEVSQDGEDHYVVVIEIKAN